MACRSCDLKRIYRLFEEKKRREAEEDKVLAETAEREAKESGEKARLPVEAIVEPVAEITEETKVEEPRLEDDLGLI